MNYNPYAAPQAAPPQAPGAMQAGAPQPWEIGEVFTRAWEIYKVQWGVLLGAMVVFGLCAFVPSIIIGAVLGATGNGPGSSAYFPTQGGLNIAEQAIQSFFMVGLIRIGLSAARGETRSLASSSAGARSSSPSSGRRFSSSSRTRSGSSCSSSRSSFSRAGCGRRSSTSRTRTSASSTRSRRAGRRRTGTRRTTSCSRSSAASCRSRGSSRAASDCS